MLKLINIKGDILMARTFTKYPNSYVNASTSRMGTAYDVINSYLSDDEIYNMLNPFEKKILAKAANSIDYQVYLMGAVEALSLANVSTSNTFDRVAEMLIENWDFRRQDQIMQG